MKMPSEVHLVDILGRFDSCQRQVMNLLDTGVNREHIGQPRQTHPPVATVDANAL